MYDTCDICDGPLNPSHHFEIKHKHGGFYGTEPTWKWCARCLDRAEGLASKPVRSAACAAPMEEWLRSRGL